MLLNNFRLFFRFWLPRKSLASVTEEAGQKFVLLFERRASSYVDTIHLWLTKRNRIVPTIYSRWLPYSLFPIYKEESEGLDFWSYCVTSICHAFSNIFVDSYKLLVECCISRHFNNKRYKRPDSIPKLFTKHCWFLQEDQLHTLSIRRAALHLPVQVWLCDVSWSWHWR